MVQIHFKEKIIRSRERERDREIQEMKDSREGLNFNFGELLSFYLILYILPWLQYTSSEDNL